MKDKHRYPAAYGRVAAVVLILAMSAPATTAGDDSCAFDQDAQKQYFLDLVRAHPEYRYDGDRTISTRTAYGPVTYSRGGCEHFGSRLIWQAPAGTAFGSIDPIVEPAVALATQFWTDMVTGEDIRRLIAGHRYQHIREPQSDTFMFDDMIDFNITLVHRLENGRRVVELSYSF